MNCVLERQAWMIKKLHVWVVGIVLYYWWWILILLCIYLLHAYVFQSLECKYWNIITLFSLHCHMKSLYWYVMFVDLCIIVKFIKKNPTRFNNVSKFYRQAHCAWQRPPTTRPTTFYVWKTRGCQCSFRLLMMGCVSPETCWASYKYGIIKFWYIVASCWIFLYGLCWKLW